MNRILFEENEINDSHVTFSDIRAEHVLNILHGEIGQILKTGTVNGKIGTAVIEKIEGGKITVKCTHENEALAPWVDLILAPPRPRVMKRLLPQLTTLGVRKIILVGAEKVEKDFWGAQLLKETIYRPLLIDGLMQAGTTQLPTISIQKSFRHYMERGGFDSEFATQTHRIVAHPCNDSTTQKCSPENISVLAVGPEGGWTDSEIEMLKDRGFALMSLGPRILRTDTAVISLLAKLM